MKEIGGFFELELNSTGDLYHKRALAFNSGSSALEFFLVNSKYTLIYLPYYTCVEVLKVIELLKLEYRFYNIDSNFHPKIDFGLLNEKKLLIVNIYFGINNPHVNKLLELSPHIIVDASQDFFYKAPKNRFYFNSPRKYFGVADGGFLGGNITKEMTANYNKLSTTTYSTKHLITRLEENANSAYTDYINNETLISLAALGKMSKLTKALLYNVDFNTVKNKRKNNFKILSKFFKENNKIIVDEFNEESIPLCYPLLIEEGSLLKKYLIKNKIYVPTYWEDIREYLSKNSDFELHLIENLVCLPIDQRYEEKDMLYIIDRFKSFLDE